MHARADVALKPRALWCRAARHRLRVTLRALKKPFHSPSSARRGLGIFNPPANARLGMELTGRADDRVKLQRTIYWADKSSCIEEQGERGRRRSRGIPIGPSCSCLQFRRYDRALHLHFVLRLLSSRPLKSALHSPADLSRKFRYQHSPASL